MTKKEAIEYLEHILDDWNTWRGHNETLCKAIEILLEDADKNENRDN